MHTLKNLKAKKYPEDIFVLDKDQTIYVEWVSSFGEKAPLTSFELTSLRK